MDIFGAVMGFISKPLTTVLERVIPDKNLRMQIDHELSMEVLKEAADKGKDFANRVIEEMKHPNWMRDAVRPIVTYASFGLYTYIKTMVVYVASKVYIPLIVVMLDGTPAQVYQRLDKIKELLSEFSRVVFTEFDFYLLLTVLSFWFGGKLLERFTEKVTQTGGIKGLLFGGKQE